jgi:uncharacterized damage-inducible protein DinB
MAADPRREPSAFAGFICRSIDRILACIDGLDEDAVHWRPPAEGANSLGALAAHTLANAEENLLGTLCGRPVSRDHEREFSGTESAAELRERWQRQRGQIEAALAVLPPPELDRERTHPRRGPLTGREVLIVVARHAAEHQGQAELTRDLLRAARPSAR